MTASPEIGASASTYGDGMTLTAAADRVRPPAQEVTRLRRELDEAITRRDDAIRAEEPVITEFGARAFSRAVGEEDLGESTIGSVTRPVRQARKARERAAEREVQR